MGSADHQFSLAEILSQNYGLQEECTEAASDPEKPEEELEKDFISQVSNPGGRSHPGKFMVSSFGQICLWASQIPQ